MTTLREEIYKLISNARSWEEIEGQNSDYYTDQILKLFEKVIDEKIAEIDKYYFTKDYQPETRIYIDGEKAGLKKLKEELKK